MMLRRYHKKIVVEKEKEETVGEKKSIHEMTKNELIEYAQTNDIKISTTMKKDKIIKLIEGDPDEPRGNVDDHQIEDQGQIQG